MSQGHGSEALAPVPDRERFRIVEGLRCTVCRTSSISDASTSGIAKSSRSTEMTPHSITRRSQFLTRQIPSALYTPRQNGENILMFCLDDKGFLRVHLWRR